MMENVFQSALDQPIQRALSRWLRDAFDGEIITPAGYIEHFGITQAIQKLSAKVRGKMFVTCMRGGDPEFAAKMNAEVLASTVASMLDGGLVTPDDICKEISTDHMVEVLPNDKLYSLVFGGAGETRPWDGDRPECKRFMAAAHEIVHAERVLEPDEYVSILEEKLVHEKTPAGLLVAGQRDAIALHRDGKTFSGEHFVKIYTPEQIVDYVALTELFPAIEAVAKRHNWIEAPKSPDASDANALYEDAEPEISVSGLASVPPDAEIEDVEADDLEELDSSDENDASAGASDASSPPPLGKRRRA